MKIAQFRRYYFSKKLICVSFNHKYLKKYLLVKENIKKPLWIHSRRQLKYQQMISKIGFSLEISLNTFNCLTVSLVPLKFLIIATFLNFSWRPLWICFGVICLQFTGLSGRRGALFLLREQICTFNSTSIKSILSFACHCITMRK